MNKLQLSNLLSPKRACLHTGGPSSSCEMIILRNNSHGGIMSLYGNIYDRSKE